VPGVPRSVKAAALLVAAAATGLAMAGCMEPFRVHVDPAVVPTGWVVTPGGVEGRFPGPKTQETRYSLDRNANDPAPFSGSLQVFSIRGLARPSAEGLLDLAEDLVERGAADKNISLTEDRLEGQRTLVSGVPSHWVVREGRTTRAGDLFEQGVTVRILAEVGHDGRSDTSFLAIGMAQVSRANQCPIVVNCQPQETNLATWIQIVGDPEGTIQGATSSTGFVDHVVTR
jgi:hypothetical protein